MLLIYGFFRFKQGAPANLNLNSGYTKHAP